MATLSGYFFLRFQKISDTQLNVARGRVGFVLEDSPFYIVKFPDPNGKISHLSLMTAGDLAGPEYVLFETEEQLQAFLTARATQNPPQVAEQPPA